MIILTACRPHVVKTAALVVGAALAIVPCSSPAQAVDPDVQPSASEPALSDPPHVATGGRDADPGSQAAPMAAGDGGTMDACASQVTLQLKGFNWPQGFDIGVDIGAYGRQIDRKVVLQRQEAADWKWVSEGVMPARDPSGPLEWYPLKLTLPAAEAKGKVVVRALLTADGPCQEAESRPETLTIVPAKHSWGNSVMPDVAKGETSRGATATLKFTARARLNAMESAPAMSTTFVVEKRVGGKGVWKTMPKVAVRTSTDKEGIITLNATIPRFSGKRSSPGGKVTYRFAPVATASIDSVPSEPITVTYFNARKVATKAVHRKCAKASVTYVKKPSREVKPIKGRVVAGYVRSGENRVYLVTSRMEKALTLAGVKQVAYHECGHILQYSVYAGRRTWGGGGAAAWQAMLRDAKAVFSKGRGVGPPHEHMADCVAQAVSGLTSQQTATGYGGKCSAKQIKAAKLLLRGKRVR